MRCKRSRSSGLNVGRVVCSQMRMTHTARTSMEETRNVQETKETTRGVEIAGKEPRQTQFTKRVLPGRRGVCRPACALAKTQRQTAIAFVCGRAGPAQSPCFGEYYPAMFRTRTTACRNHGHGHLCHSARHDIARLHTYAQPPVTTGGFLYEALRP